MRLQGRTALVTGATSGIGEAIARAFASEGARVVITGRDEERGQEVIDAISAASGAAFFVEADLAMQKDVVQLVAATEKLVGPINILVNNAAIFPLDKTENISEELFDQVIATNFKAPFFLTAAFAQQMVARGSGKIINITTVLAHKGLGVGALYGSTKAALTLLTKAWAEEYGPSGVNVNAIAPHLVRTPGTEGDLEALQQVAQQIPARRYARPAEIAAAAVYLASADADFVHGVTLPVDGGYLAI